MINNLTLFTYTHSSCIDIHNIYSSRLNKYFPDLKKHLLICDKELDYENIKTLTYNDTDDFSNHILLALDNIDTDFLIYSQEDCILYNKVDIEEINYCLSVLHNDSSIPFIRLIWSGIGHNYSKYNEKLSYVGKSEYYYCTQMTIWRKDILKDLYSKVKVKHIFEEANLSEVFFNMNNKGLVYSRKGKKVSSHYDSLIYPYISTAIVKRKWNYTEYKNELDDIFKEFKIDPNIRGIYKANLKVKLYRILKKFRLL